MSSYDDWIVDGLERMSERKNGGPDGEGKG